MIKRTICAGSLALFNAMMYVSANGDHSAGTAFPAWSYWIEIVEHAGLIFAAIAAVIYLVLLSKKQGKGPQDFSLMFYGLGMLAASQILTNLHHFKIYLFAEWNAIIHHGLLVAAFILVLYAYIVLAKKGVPNEQEE